METWKMVKKHWDKPKIQEGIQQINQASGVKKQEQLNTLSKQHEGPYLSPKVVENALLYIYDLRSVTVVKSDS